jgi:hypothetical protein
MERIWRWCQRYPDAIAAAVLVVFTISCLGADGALDRLDALPASAAMIGVAALVAGRRRRPVLVAVAAGVLVAVPEFAADSSRIYNGLLIIGALAAVFLYSFALGSDCPGSARCLASSC